MALIQGLLRAVYPPQCLSCRAEVTEEGTLCGACWRATPFISGLVCELCGAPLIGDSAVPVQCDECLATARPWLQGRAAMLYRDNGRRLVLAFKHGDRGDLAPALAAWMHRAGAPLLTEEMLVAPVPLHWWRLARRRYNQAALLSGRIAQLAGMPHCPDLLRRLRATPTQDGRNREARFANLDGALAVAPRRRALAQGRAVLLVDDVFTSGATLAAAAEACLAAGAARVRVLALARVARGD